ncbi:MAG TPA: NADH-quinone oxidoreductase subunit N [Candidatus Thermoplasmatota archaeon]|nr:NADH-quinone oxidoreductase subunit N [Candidatus Thermoplasmatota archaeon]
MAISADHAVLLPIYILVGVGSFLPLLGAFRWRGGVLATLSALAIVAAMVLTLGMVWEIPGLGFLPDVEPGNAPVISFALLEMTPFVALFDLVFLSVALVVVLGSPRYIGRHQGEYYSLVLLATIGMMVVAASRDLITLFIGIELSSLCTFALAGYFKNRVDSSEAAMKYFLIGSISAALALFGISLVYGLTGGTSFEHLAGVWDDPLRDASGATTTIGDQLLAGRFTIGVFIWGLLLAGFGYKVAFVPFHNYAADVYEGAPSTVSGFLAAGSKQMGFAALFKVFFLGLFAVKANWDIMVGVLAIITMIVGNVVALQQTNIKRMLAYSSIAQAGYILLALAVGTEYALAGGLFHIVTYSFMQVGAFIALAAAATWGIGDEMADWKGAAKRAPFLAFAMAVFMLSFAGIPPLAGFASKFVLFSSAILAATDASAVYATLYYALALVGIATSAISLVYYWRLIRVMYVEEGEGRRIVVTSAAGIAVAISLVATIVIGILPSFVLGLSLDAAQHLFAGLATVGP